MPRWIQKIDKETGKSRFVPADEGAHRIDKTAAIHGDIEPFRSPIDGTVISDRKAYREHMEKHGVVPASEFSPEFYERKKKERDRFYAGEVTQQQRQKRKEKIHRIIEHHELKSR